MSTPKKILIIRFSSFGDIVFTLSTLPVLLEHFGPEAKVDWLLRSDMSSILEREFRLHHLWSFDRKAGLGGLMKLAWRLRKEQYDVVYDAHANVRSFIVRFIVTLFSRSTLIVRPKERLKRFLLFKLRKNYFPKPFKAMESFLAPLQEAGINGSLQTMSWDVSDCAVETDRKIILVPGTAWPMKTWPLDYWKKVVELLPEQKFIVLGGPQDDFCQEIAEVDTSRVENLAGKLSLFESCQVVAKSDFVVTADTGLAQVADLSGRDGITIIGPTAFGFPSMGTMKVLERDLPCRPCTKDGRGTCSQEVYQRCMVEIMPEDVVVSITKNYKP